MVRAYFGLCFTIPAEALLPWNDKEGLLSSLLETESVALKNLAREVECQL